MGLTSMTWLVAIVALLSCWCTCSAASVRGLEDAERVRRQLEDMEPGLQRDTEIYGELVSRLRALSEAEQQAGLAHKRGFDFGLGRGFSATQAAKHKMGLEAAAFPSGPGRRRRSLAAGTRL